MPLPSFKLLRMLELNHRDALSSLFSMSTDAKRGKCITNERSRNSIYGLLVVYIELYSADVAVLRSTGLHFDLAFG